jgi:DNA-binding transcriptional ArsR family regulator
MVLNNEMKKAIKDKDRVYERLVLRLKAIAHPGRLRILAELRRGPCCVGDMQRCVGLSQPHVSQSLKVLKKAGIVASHRQGTRICYRIVDPAVENILKKLMTKEIER